MAAQTVTVKLTLPYPMRPEELASIRPKTPEAVAREISEMFIARAVLSQHGQELDQKTARMYAGIKRELDTLEDTLTLNGTQWEWFAALFFGAKAEETKIPPAHVVWFFQWVDYLEEVRTAAKAEGLTLGEATLWTILGLGATMAVAVVSALVSRLHTLERQIGALESQVAAIAARQQLFAQEREQQRRPP